MHVSGCVTNDVMTVSVRNVMNVCVIECPLMCHEWGHDQECMCQGWCPKCMYTHMYTHMYVYTHDKEGHLCVCLSSMDVSVCLHVCVCLSMYRYAYRCMRMTMTYGCMRKPIALQLPTASFEWVTVCADESWHAWQVWMSHVAGVKESWYTRLRHHT